jgi:hypothetical protein
MCLKLVKEIKNPFPLVNLIGDDFKITFEFFKLISKIKREVCGVLDYFVSFQRKYEERKAHKHVFYATP